MPTVDLTADSFSSAIARPGIVLVDFWAAWCGPCRQFAPVFEQAAADHPDYLFAKVDTEVEQALSGRLGITSIPTLMVFRDEILVYREPGALPSAALTQLIGAVEALDMNEVRREVAERTPAGRDRGDRRASA